MENIPHPRGAGIKTPGVASAAAGSNVPAGLVRCGHIHIADERLARIFGDPAAAGLNDNYERPAPLVEYATPVDLYKSYEGSLADRRSRGTPLPRTGARKRGTFDWDRALTWGGWLLLGLYAAKLWVIGG